jgi:hypothetical protein
MTPLAAGARHAVGNLPADVTSFVGRRHEIAEAKRLLAASRVVTLTCPVALTSLLTLSALAPLADVGSPAFVAHAALLALIVAAVRLLLGVCRWGAVAYLMSQPVVSAFTVAAAILIVASQIPAVVDVGAQSQNPFLSAAHALSRPDAWEGLAILIGVATITAVILGRRISPLFPVVLLATIVALPVSTLGIVDVSVVGEIPAGLPPLDLGLPGGQWGCLSSPASSSRWWVRRAGVDRPPIRRRRPDTMGPPNGSSLGKASPTSPPACSTATRPVDRSPARH